MNAAFRSAAAASVLVLAASAAFAGTHVTETRAVDARVTRVVLDSVIELKLRQGPPSMTVHGDSDLIKKLTTEQSGDTLRINSESHSMRFGSEKSSELRVELSLPNFSDLKSNGVGATTISGFSGDRLEIDLGGAGHVAVVDSRYRKVKAKLSGVGSLNVDARDADELDFRMPGAGAVTVTGTAKKLDVGLSGVGSLNAKELTVGKASLSLSGLGSATLTAKDEASVSLSGLGSATVYGNPPQRSASTSGLGRVNFK